MEEQFDGDIQSAMDEYSEVNPELVDLATLAQTRYVYLLKQLEFNVMEVYPSRRDLWRQAFLFEIVRRNLGSQEDYRYQQLMLEDILDGINLHDLVFSNGS